jgi:catalase
MCSTSPDSILIFFGKSIRMHQSPENDPQTPQTYRSRHLHFRIVGLVKVHGYYGKSALPNKVHTNFSIPPQDDWDQPRGLWEKFPEEEKEQTLDNIVGMLAPAQPFLQERVVGLFGKIHPDMAEGLNKRLKKGASAQQTK